MTLPNKKGYFGTFGGRFIPETLLPTLIELEAAYRSAKKNPAFREELAVHLRDFVGRPTPLMYARRLSEAVESRRIYLKREDLCQTGAHKINNALGQALLTRFIGKKRVIAERAQASTARRRRPPPLSLASNAMCSWARKILSASAECFSDEALGARVIPVKTGTRTLKDAINEALRDWVTNVRPLIMLSALPSVRTPFHDGARFPIRDPPRSPQTNFSHEGRLPNYVMACVGGGSNAIGLFHPFYADRSVNMIGVEPAGKGLASGQHAAPLARGTKGVFHGTLSYLLQDSDGQITGTHSLSAGLDYPGVGPEHSFYKDTHRAELRLRDG